MRKIQTLGVLGVTPADPRAGTPSHTRHSPWVLSLRVADAQARACTNPASHLPATRHSFDPQPDLSLGAGKTRENTETRCASNRNIPKTGRSGSLIPAAHTDTALPAPVLSQGVPGSFLPSQEGSFLGSIPWICPSGRVIPKFNPPGMTLTCSRASSAQPPSHSHRLIG